LSHRVAIEEVHVAEGRVLVVHVPSRLPGAAWALDGRFLKRAGDGVVPMTDAELRTIFAESGPDFSAQVCPDAKLADLDLACIEVLRRLWLQKSGNPELAARPVERLLTDAELLVDGRVTYAALILLGARESLGRFLAQAEIVFEYRPTEAAGPAAARHEFRQGALPILDEIWRLISLRNDLQHFHQGMFMWNVPTFNDRVIREALLNAVSHRDYRHGGSVFVRQYPRHIEIVSPGGFPPGITRENILWQQNPRNRRIAEVLSKCGLVERAGQGINYIVQDCIRNSKPLPDFSRTDDHAVWLTLRGEIQDPEFLRFLEEIGSEQIAQFSTDDYLVVDLVHRDEKIPQQLAARIEPLLELGVIERIGRGRGARIMLSRRFFKHLGKAGTYTHKVGLDREASKRLLLNHLLGCVSEGAPMGELEQVLPGMPRRQILLMLEELRSEGSATLRGAKRGARWFAIKP